MLSHFRFLKVYEIRQITIEVYFSARMSFSGKTILVTGGGGYIGSHCTLELLNEGFNVVAIDNFVNSIIGKFITALLVSNLIKSLIHRWKF
jgi:hypothetical protein